MSESFFLRSIAVVDRSFSTTSLLGRPTSTDEELRAAAGLLAAARRAVSIVCGQHSDGRVLVGSTKRVRRVLQSRWRPPGNADFVHYGALRGLDFAREHVAAVSVGHPELPPEELDGLAAALGYDDEEPAASLGRGSDTGPTFEERILRLRDGREVSIRTPVRRDHWARILQDQFREQELLQFVGRLRPVYRSGTPPVWYALTNALPTSLIWDQVMSLDDLLTVSSGDGRIPRNLYEMARRCGGILSPEVASVRCGDLASREMLYETFLSEGFDPKSGDLTDRYHGRGWARRGWTDGTDRKIPAWVAASVADNGETLERELRLANFDVRAIERRGYRACVGIPKTPDEVDANLGTIDERCAQEEADRQDRVGHLLALRYEVGGTYMVGSYGLELVRNVQGVELRTAVEEEMALAVLKRSRSARVEGA